MTFSLHWMSAATLLKSTINVRLQNNRLSFIRLLETSPGIEMGASRYFSGISAMHMTTEWAKEENLSVVKSGDS